jgi:short-subunit dehydrogenase
MSIVKKGDKNMKNVVITGSTRGIGLAMAKEFIIAGCNITLAGRGKNISESLKKELEDFSGQFIYVQCDVRNNEEIEILWEKSIKKWGQIDIWINNAGINCPFEYCYSTEASYADSVIDTNIKGVIYGSQVAAKNMLAQGSGQIWNIEGLGSDGMIQEKTVLYGMTKRALTYFTGALARELEGTPVKAGRLAPGMMLTDFITKTPDGDESPVMNDKGFKFVFNTLGEKPETVAASFVPKILTNKKNNAHIVWLTKGKIIWRFMTSMFHRRKLI